VPGVHLESKDYILLINFEAVLDESLYSDTVYAAESITSEGIHIGNFDDAGWTTAYRFIYVTDDNTERNSDVSEDNYVATGNASTSTGLPKKFIYKFESKNKLDFSENDSVPTGTASTSTGSPEKLIYKSRTKNRLDFLENNSVLIGEEFTPTEQSENSS